jgi:hypothetical protein
MKFSYFTEIDGKKVQVSRPRLGLLKVNITYVCDRGCLCCNRACRLAPSKHVDDLKPEDFKKMLDDSVANDKKWISIVLTGGEPSMHPKFQEMVDILIDYKHKHNPEVEAAVYTYHHPVFFQEVEEAKKRHPDLVVVDTMKDAPVTYHATAHYMAPIDDPKYGPDHQYTGCKRGVLCGLCQDYQGIWCCPQASGIGRVFGFDVSLKEVKDISLDSMSNMYNSVCRYCGYYTNAYGKNKEPISKSWEEALLKFRKGSPIPYHKKK